MMLRHCVAAFIVTVVAMVSCVTAGEPAPVVELRIFDVRDITSSVADFTAPRTVLGYHSDVSAAEDEEFNHVRAEDLQTLVKDKLLPAQFADPMTSIEESGGKLVVMQTPATNKLIEQIIVNFRSVAKPQIAIRALLLSAAEAPDETYFDENAVTLMQKQSTVLACPRIVCFTGQRTFALDGRKTSFVSDYDISGNDYDPLIQTMLQGTTLEVRPTLSASRSTVELELRFSHSNNVTRSDLKLGIDTPGGASSPVLPPESSSNTVVQGEDAKEKTVTTHSSTSEGRVLGAQYTSQIEIQLGSMESNCVRTHATIPVGKWILASVTNDLKNKDNKLLLLVTAEELGKK